MDQASRIAWYKQQVPRAKEWKRGTISAEEQLRDLLSTARYNEIFPELAVADIGRMVYIALGDLAKTQDDLFEIWDEAKWLAGPDLGAVESHFTRRRLEIAAAEINETDV